MKKSFSLLELILVIFIIILIGSFVKTYTEDDNLRVATNKIVLFLKQTRYQALIDNKENTNENLWYKKRWTLKFLRCRKNIGGLYYVVYSDENMTGHPSIDESLEDPLTKKKIYSSNKCEVTANTSKYTLLTKEFGIDEVNVSCNNTSSLGQISFGSNGKVYSKLSNNENEESEYEIKEKCEIELISQKGAKKTVVIEAKTAYVYIK